MRARTLAWGAALLWGCAPVPTIDVSIGGLAEDVRELEARATLNDRRASNTQRIGPDLSRFRIELPQETTGTLKVHVNGLDPAGCLVQAGEGGPLAVTGPGRYDLAVPLLPVERGCRLIVRTEGDGHARFTSDPPGLDGKDEAEASFPPGTQVRLETQALSGAMLINYAGACTGRACSVTIRGDGPIRVTARIAADPACSSGRWCVDAAPLLGVALRGLSGSSADDVWAVGDGGTILRGDGARWRKVASPTPRALHGVALSGPAGGWAVGDGGTVLRWDGGAWTRLQDSGTAADLYAVLVRGGEVLLAGAGGALLRGSAPDFKFTAESSGTGAALRALWGSASEAWAAGDGGTVLRRRTGEAWTPVPTPGGTGRISGLWGSGQGEVWAVAEGGRILMYQPGAGFVPEGAGLTAAGLRGVWGSGAGDRLAVGEAGTLLRRTGAQWSRVDSGVQADLLAVWGPERTTAWAAGVDGTILRYVP